MFVAMTEPRRDIAGGERLRIGPSAERLGRSPRMVRYLEEHGVLRPERGPGPGGHRHFPPPELALGAAASQALDAGYASAVLRALREMADRRVAAALADPDPLAWFELLAISRAVEAQVRAQLPPPPPPHHGPPPPPPPHLRGERSAAPSSAPPHGHEPAAAPPSAPMDEVADDQGEPVPQQWDR